LLRHARPGRKLRRIEMISASMDCLRAKGTSGKVTLVNSPSKASFPAPGIVVEDPLEVIALDEWLNEAQPDTVDLTLLR